VPRVPGKAAEPRQAAEPARPDAVVERTGPRSAKLAAHGRAAVRGTATVARALRAASVRGLPVLATGLAAAVPVIVSTVNAVRAGWEPDGDDGIILTRALDVFTAHSPLVGQYSEAGRVTGQIVHSPGPLLYWLLAIPVRLGGPASAAIAMGVLNTLCVIAVVALARRRGGVWLMFAVSIGIALMCQSLAAEVFHDVWNPSAAMFPFLLLIFLCWSLACGDLATLPAIALLASFVVQTHLAYLAPTAALVAIGLAGVGAIRLVPWLRARRSRLAPGRSHAWRWVLGAIVVLAICWSGPAIDEIEHSPGNLSLIVTTVHDRGSTLGSAAGWNSVVRAVGVRPWFLYVPRSEWDRKRDVRSSPSGGETVSAIVLLVLLALVAAVAALRRRIDLFTAAVIGLALCAGLAADAANTPADPLLSGTLGYTMWWGSEVGLWVWLVLAWSVFVVLARVGRFTLLPVLARLAGSLPVRRPRALGAARRASVVAGIVATLAVASAVAGTQRRDSHAREYLPTATIGRALVTAIPAHRTIDYELGSLDLATQPIEPAVRFWLVAHGDRPLADGSLPRLGNYYQLGDRHYDWIVLLTDGTAPHRPLRLLARVRFRDQSGSHTLSAWVGRAPSRRPKTARRARGAVAAAS